MKPVVTFGIPIAPKVRITYWQKAMRNLNRTLQSLENQTCDAYNVVLVGYVEDEVWLDKPYRNLHKEGITTMNDFSQDKDDKTLLAMDVHANLGANYFFRLDWDDLLHKDLVKFLAENPDEHGWMIWLGYFYKPATNMVVPIQNYWGQCGSAYAINYTEAECRGGPVHSFHHQQIPKHRKALGKPLRPLDFFGGMYVVHGDNISTPKHERILPRAPWRHITGEEKENFGLGGNNG